MKISTYAATALDIERCRKAPDLEEVMIEPALLALEGRLSMDDAERLGTLARGSSLKPVLVWDVLMTHSTFQATCADLKRRDLDRFDAIRVKDLGAAAWLQSNHPGTPLQLILEGNSHNMEAIKGWVEHFGDQLETVVLSIELPEKKLIQYCEEIPTKFEILGAGPILIFYSPRHLLSRALMPEESVSNAELWMTATSSSEESQGRAFVTKQTPHGTLMFLNKDQFILDKLQNLEDAGLDTVRVDLRDRGECLDAASGIEDTCRLIRKKDPSIRRRWPRRTLAPFFGANATSKQFERLKSKLHALRDESCLAQVISGENGKFMVLYAIRGFDSAQAKQLVLPNGEVLAFPPIKFLDSRGKAVERCEANRVFVISWVRKACNGALVRDLTT